jgi:diamine N-acetyltransferase
VNNESSTSLFAKFGFHKVGIKKDWNLIEGVYRDEALFQLVKSITK